MSAPRPPRWHGLLLVDKPSGLTSHDVVNRVRGLAGQRQVGHTGTLDPLATGLLALLLGSTTRLEPYLVKADKTYSGRLELGLSTDTDDISGRVLARQSGPWPEQAKVERALKRLEGPREQIPPAYSAIRVAGRRAHQAARAGAPLELKPRLVTARCLELTGYDPPHLDFRAEVSSGYYIRSLARDLGAGLGLGGALTSLRRERVGPWPVTQAALLSEMAGWSEDDWPLRLRPPAEALPHWPALTLAGDSLGRFGQGQTLAMVAETAAGPEAGDYKILDGQGRLIGLGQLSAPSFGGPSPRGPFLRPLRVFNSGQ